MATVVITDNKMPPYPANLDYSKQSIEVPGTKRPGQTGHYRNAVFGLIDENTPGALKSIQDIYNTGFARSKNKPIVGRRPVISTNPLKFADHFVWETYAQFDVRRRAVGNALQGLFANGNLKGDDLQTVGIWSINRPEWQVIDIGVQTYGMVSVSLYDTLGKDSVEYIINHAHLSVIFATAQHIPTLLKMASKTPCLKLIVSIDPLSAEAKAIATTWAEAQGIQVKELSDIEAIGKLNPVEPAPVKTTDICTICYTSGTTGNPKGVVLTHAQLSLGVQAQLCGSSIVEEASMLSYLPLAHIYARMCELAVIAIGGRMGYFTGDPLRLLEDIQILKPIYFPSVPRVLNRIYQAAMVAGNVPGLKGALFKRAVDTKMANFRATGQLTHAFWDKLVFRKIQAVLGGKIMMISSGSAPISPDVVDFMRIAFGCEFIEGYGMTENGGTCTRVFPSDPTSSGTVGPPQASLEIKLVDVLAMGYTSEDKPNPRGEICCRGPCVFTTYYHDEVNTASTVDAEGWVHTGDVGEIDQSGRLKVIDRVKNIMKLAQGEYVALEKVENLYSAHPLVAQLFVYGDSLQSYLVAVLVPDPVQLATITSKVWGKQVAAEDGKELIKATRDPAINKAILAEISKEADRNQLKGFERLKRIYLSLDAFTVDNGCLTPTLKIRRKDAYNKFKQEIDALYALGEPSSSEAAKL